jgi:hypothetical protein
MGTNDSNALAHQEECHDFATRFTILLICRVSVTAGRIQDENGLSYSLDKCNCYM